MSQTVQVASRKGGIFSAHRIQRHSGQPVILNVSKMYQTIRGWTNDKVSEDVTMVFSCQLEVGWRETSAAQICQHS